MAHIPFRRAVSSYLHHSLNKTVPAWTTVRHCLSIFRTLVRRDQITGRVQMAKPERQQPASRPNKLRSLLVVPLFDKEVEAPKAPPLPCQLRAITGGTPRSSAVSKGHERCARIAA